MREHSLPGGRGLARPERRTMVVGAIAAVAMVAEVAGGLVLGSMALLADGIHMAAHTLAMGVAVWAYAYARWHADDPRFAFGTGKVNALGGYTGAVVLGMTALGMAWESLVHLWEPEPIAYGPALGVAMAGLGINLVSAWLLRDAPEGACGDGHHHGHGHSHAHDHNLRAAYLHVLSDAVTSVLAIAALLAAWQWHVPWLDAVVGLVGAVVIGWWAVGLVASASATLLDHRGPADLERRLSLALAREDGVPGIGVRSWAVGPGRYAAMVSVTGPLADTLAEMRARVPSDPTLAIVAVDITR